MGLRDFFSRRMARAAKAGQPDVYQYDDLPEGFRVQVVHIWKRAVGGYRLMSPSRLHGPSLTLWDTIEEDLAEAHHVFHLANRNQDAFTGVANYFLQQETPKALDVIEAVFSAIDEHIRRDLHYAGIYVKQHPDDAIADLNERFREHGIGYQYVNGQIIRVDSQYVHAEIVKPALNLLADPALQGPNDEFLKAHEHYRHNRYKECLTECLKAFESTIKVICDRHGWAYNKTDTASKLIDVCFAQKLIPDYLQAEFTALAAVLKSGVPTVRNKQGGHGQGAMVVTVPPYLASYVLHLTAANILLLVEAEKDVS